MPCHEEKASLPPLEALFTDAEAEIHIPPHAVARNTYASYRAEGLSPTEALRLTLEIWREFQEHARPAGSSRSK